MREAVPEVTLGCHLPGPPRASSNRYDLWLPEHAGGQPRKGESEYVDEVLAACRAGSVDWFWPGRALAHFARRAGEFASAGVGLLLVSSAPVLDLLDDKLAFAAAAAERGLPVPTTLEFCDLDGFNAAYEQIHASGKRVCFKPRRGIYGLGFRVVHETLDPFADLLEPLGHRLSLADARARFGSRSTFQPMVAMNWLPGTEWSLDCFRSADGASFVAVPRKKESDDTQLIEPRSDLLALARQVAEAFDLRGAFNCQFKMDGPSPFLLEVNARPAGGVGAGQVAGVNTVAMALRDALGLPVEARSVGEAVRAERQTGWAAGAGARPPPSELGTAPTPDVARELEAGPVAVRAALPDPGRWTPARLLDLGQRRGAGRRHLLVSRVLGKHLPVTPSRMREACEALANRLPELAAPALFVGMAETATGLGWGVFEAWRARTGRTDGCFWHSTRYPIDGHPRLEFQEKHSHGPYHVLCGRLPALGSEAGALVVIDDELSTGSTALHLSEALATQAPASFQRVACALVDARPPLAPAEGPLAGWEVVSLCRVAVEAPSIADSHPERVRQPLRPLPPRVGALAWGRLGALAAPPLPPEVRTQAEAFARGAPVTYVLGVGELLYPAWQLAAALEARGMVTLVQATTRSPVAVGGAIGATLDCDDIVPEGVPHFAHNPPPLGARVIVVHEPGAACSARALVATRGALLLEAWGEDAHA